MQLGKVLVAGLAVLVTGSRAQQESRDNGSLSYQSIIGSYLQISLPYNKNSRAAGRTGKR